MRFFTEFHMSGLINACLKDNFICLIPRKENVEKIKDFRPISLTPTYKSLAKVLTERLRHVIPNIISLNQSGFIEGRQILDPVLIANEFVDFYRTQKKSGWILKLDIEKAFDRMNWDFLVVVLNMKGFGSRWIKWINGCIRGNKFSVFINI